MYPLLQLRMSMFGCVCTYLKRRCIAVVMGVVFVFDGDAQDIDL
jgi:hypothetical protein